MLLGEDIRNSHHHDECQHGLFVRQDTAYLASYFVTFLDTQDLLN